MGIVRNLLFVLIFTVGAVCHAQTPTPHPNALQNGYYEFKDLASPQIELPEGSWTVGSDYLRGSGAYEMEFYVTDETDFLIIGATAEHSSDTARFNLCVVALSRCLEIRLEYTEQEYIELYEINSLITIIRTNNNTRFHFMELHSVANTGSVSGTEAVATPDYVVPITVSGTSGEFHYVITAGDVSIINALIFLFLSLWAIILIMLVFKPHVW